MTTKMQNTITVLLGDPRLPDRSKPGGKFTPDDIDQVIRLRKALSELSFYTFEYIDDHDSLLEFLHHSPPTLVLNFCDTGYRNDAQFELHVAAYLELLKIPYSGSGPVALGLCYDKSFVRSVAEASGISVPWENFIAAGDRLDNALDKLQFPAFIKPNRGDGSVGITQSSIVHNVDEARQCIQHLRELITGCDLIAQEFLSGDEYGIGVIGNPAHGFDFLPALEVDYSDLDPELPRLLDYSSKTDPLSPYWQDIKFRPARISETQLAKMAGWCRTLFQRLRLCDYARFDFRATAGGEIKLMEVNPNPAWCHDGKLAHMASVRGEDHAALLEHIINASRTRLFNQDIRKNS